MSKNERKIIDFLKKSKIPSEVQQQANQQKLRRNSPSPYSKR